MSTLNTVAQAPSIYATVLSSTDDDVIKLEEAVVFSNFGPSLASQSGLAVNGLEIILTAAYGAVTGDTLHNIASISLNGTDYSDALDPSDVFTTSLATRTIGGSTELFGFNPTSVTTAILANDHVVRVGPAGGPAGNILYIDSLTLRIHFSVGPAGNQINFSSGHLLISDGHIII